MSRRIYFSLVCLILVSFVLGACAPASTPEPTASTVPSETPVPATFTPEATATRTPRPTFTPRPSATPNLVATVQYEDMSVKAKEYFDAGYISTSSGEAYKRLPVFKDEWAQLGWYQWTHLDYFPSDFIIDTDIEWESASASADTSGCGFIFRQADNDNYYVMYISLKGYVIPYIVSAGDHNRLSVAYYGLPAQNGSVHLTLIVEGDTFKVLVDDKLIKSYVGFKEKLLGGRIGYTVFSGTNKDYGTRCIYSNTDLWTIKK